MSENTFDRFSVFFTGDTVFLDGAAFSLGQLITDVLNLDGGLLTEIDQRVDDFISVEWTLLQKNRQRRPFRAGTTQRCLGSVSGICFFALPAYRSLHLDIETARSLFPGLLSDRAKWSEVLDVDSEGHRMFEEFLSGLEYFAENLRNFSGQLDGMLELYFETLSRRSAEAYAETYAAYFTDMAAAGELFFPEQEFNQSFPARLCFVPMAHPTGAGKVLLAEKV